MMEKKPGYYIVDGDYVEIPKDSRGIFRFFCNRFFTGIVMWFLPWLMVVLAADIAFRKNMRIVRIPLIAAFISSFFVYHALRKKKDGQGFFFVFTVVIILFFACFLIK